MHIKQVTISNFRSFREQPEINPFSAGTNCVVGRNGSGKSNYFDAIQFVLLAPRFYALRSEERQALLHEGSGSAAVNAFVEIVFDNSDNRFSLENSDEVVLRRTIGPKKDEFFLQRRRATKQEISSLLEGAGFSKSNPYFMIQQGKIQGICTMRDAERLALLKQVAGTTVYDEKKQESLAKMEENQKSIDKIQDMLTDIEARLEELHGEKEELANYQKYDRQRRAIEYTLYDKELRRARHVLDNLEYDRTEHMESLSAIHEQAKEAHDAIRNIEATMKVKTNALTRNRRIVSNSLEVEKAQAIQAHALVQFQCQELGEAIDAAEKAEEDNKKELHVVEQEIQQNQQRLNALEPRYHQELSILQQKTHESEQTKKSIEGMLAKQGRGKTFLTKEDRDSYLRSAIEDLAAVQSEKASALRSHEEALSTANSLSTSVSKDLEVCKADINRMAESLQTLNKSFDVKKRERLEIHETRQQEWRRAEELCDQVREARESMHGAYSDFCKVMPRNTAMGVEALGHLVKKLGLVVGKQYFGMLMDNMKLKDTKYQTAVEVAAQNSLFHVIVDNDGTAARLMRGLEEGKLGRVTFLPLNRLRVERPVDLTQHGSPQDVKNMLEMCIDYEPLVAKAMQHVFGRKLLARNSEVASEWSSRLGCDAITLDGDLCSRKGALTGGYVDSQKSRMSAHSNHKDAKEELHRLERMYQESRSQAQQTEQASAQTHHELQRLEAKRTALVDHLSRKENEAERLQNQLEQQKKQVEKIETNVLPPLKLEISGIVGDMTRLQQEMGTELVSTRSAEEQKSLQLLKQKERDLSTEIGRQSDLVSELSLERQKLQSLLEDYLMKRRRELQSSSAEGTLNEEEDDDDLLSPRRNVRNSFANASATVFQRKQELEEKLRELEISTRVKDTVEKKLIDARKTQETLRTELIAAKNELEQYKSQDAKCMKALEEAQDKSERLLNKRSMCIAKRETYARKIQELGSLPPPAERAEFGDKSISNLMKCLETTNKKLKKYSHVNKKAYDQYVNFSEQRDGLLKRNQELERSALKVSELLESLDRQKDEAINRTFRGVSAHFKDVFKELIPSGAGELIMKTAIDDQAETDRDADPDDLDEANLGGKSGRKDNVLNPEVSLYRGVGIKVRFSETGGNYIMSQLSGGQKALVALALIFAIQRCDPAPFYIFDELDQALDSSYRASVASLIQRQANSTENPTQFIVSTFRPELVGVSSRCYGVSHQNKVSSVHHMSKKDSLHFVANLMNEEETLGEVATVTTSRTSRRLTESSRKRKANEEVDNELIVQN